MTDLRPKYLARRLRKAPERPTWVISAPGPITREMADQVLMWANQLPTQMTAHYAHGHTLSPCSPGLP